MSDDRDPKLQSLFADTDEELGDDGFTGQVMSRVDRARYSVRFSRYCVALVIVLFAGLIAGPLIGAVDALTEVLPRPLIDIDEGWFGVVFAPLNSLSGLLGIALLGLVAAFKKLFSR